MRLACAALFVLAAAYAVVLAFVILNRMTWPYEIEWMEGGMLMHAVRVRLGEGIYVEPSASFVPYFYTPLYPLVVAGLASAGLPLGFGLGRAVSAVRDARHACAVLYARSARARGAAGAGASWPRACTRRSSASAARSTTWRVPTRSR